MQPVACPGCLYSGQSHLEDCPRAASAVFSKTVSMSKAAKKAVEGIVKDLSDRRGLRHEWDQIDSEIKREIQNKWTEIIEISFLTGGTSWRRN